MPETVHYTENSRPFRRELVPELIYDANPALVDFYYLAWKQAWEHIYETESLPFSPYIGEGCKRDRIWIWDSCLMGMFCRYAADVYPVCSTLDNLYALRDGRSGYPINIHHLDNPPLFAWTELLLYRQTGDEARLKKILPVLISRARRLLLGGLSLRHGQHPARARPLRRHSLGGRSGAAGSFRPLHRRDRRDCRRPRRHGTF